MGQKVNSNYMVRKAGPLQEVPTGQKNRLLKRCRMNAVFRRHGLGRFACCFFGFRISEFLRASAFGFRNYAADKPAK